MRRYYLLVCITAANLLFAGFGVGQPTEPSTATSPAPSAADFVRQAAQSDMFEIKSGQMAQQKAAGARVRSFGQMMVSDHTKTTQALTAAAARAGLAAPSPDLSPEQKAMLDQLGAASGSAFDSLYLTQQKDAHRQALSLHSAYAAGGDNAALKRVAQSAVPVVRRHLETLDSLGGSPAAGARP